MTLDRDLVTAALPTYEIGAEIGRGGWGIVLHGRHRALGREVAIKQLPRAFAASESALQRFIDEAQIVGQLDHPHIVTVYDFVEHEGLWLMVMEYLSGGTLWDRFTEQGLRSDQACAVTMAVCAGLDAAHEQGVLHRDLKPENILFTGEGVPRLGDFGIAKNLDTDLRRTRAGEVVGTPTYMSPEQAMGHELTRACDVYSLAIVLYELLAGRLPFEEARTPTQQLIQHTTEAPLALSSTAPDIPGAISDVVMDALEKRPDDRTATAQAFGVALARAAGETYGPGWLRESGIRLMGGGRIEAAAHRDPTMDAPRRTPTLARPALRSDHFRPTNDADTNMPDEAKPEPSPTASPVVVPAASPTIVPQAVGEASPETPPPGASSETISAPAPSSAPSGSRTPWVITAVVAAVALVTVVVIVLSRGGDGGVDTAADQDAPQAAATATPSTDEPTSQPAVVEPDAPAATEQPAPTEAEGFDEQTCPVAARCAFIDSVSVDGDSLVVEWTAIGFEPSYQAGFIHVHFFWDIYSAAEVGTNAATFGMSQGAWEVTDEQPFRSLSEVAVSNKPIPANQICVTPANFGHAVVDPLRFDCAPLPDGM